MAEEIVFETTVSYLLAKVGNIFRTSLDRKLIPLGLHSGRVFVLIELWRRDGQKQIDLANRINVAAPTLSKMITGLEEINLVERRVLEGDARATRIFLTPQGWAIKGEISPHWREFEVNFLSSLTESEGWMIADLLGKIRAANSPGETNGDDE
ncbi:MAG: MarR family winged helix-turn-helix transcriptional regulator [Pyrinomonadaceae bacterium]